MTSRPGRRAASVALLLITAASGCERLLMGASDAQVIVDVFGADGKPFRPDQVVWYYPPVDGAAEQFEAGCLDLQCTRWGVEGAIPGLIYVAASYSRPHVDSRCAYHAFDAAPVEVDREERQRVRLEMEVQLGCQ